MVKFAFHELPSTNTEHYSLLLESAGANVADPTADNAIAEIDPHASDQTLVFRWDARPTR
jgi:hypothetical protein